MKQKVLKKLSGVVAILLLISMLTPVLAFASTNFGTTDFSKANGTVSGTVYTDKDVVTGSVYFNVYSQDGSTLLKRMSASEATYTRKDTVSGITYYDFNTSVTGRTYDYLNLKGEYNGLNNLNETATQAVYSSDTPRNNNSGNGSVGGGGGGGSVTPPTTGDTSPVINVGADGSVDKTALANAYSGITTSNPNVTLKLAGDFVLLPASALLAASKVPGATLTITSDAGTYIIPLDSLKLEELAAKLGINIADLMIRVEIRALSDSEAKPVVDAISKQGLTQMAKIVDFNVYAIDKDGKKVEINFGNRYIKRKLTLTGTGDLKRMTGVIFLPTATTVNFVPSTFEVKDSNNTEATLMRNGSSIYTVVQANKSFNDTASHWAKSDVDLLTNKLVIDGVTATTFEPDRSITRAEFAALAVRSLGLMTNVTSSKSFKDVSSTDWFAGVVSAAANAGIIDGYEDGSFHPNATITREELAAMVVRSLGFAGVKTDISTDRQNQMLAKFTDSYKIVWAQNSIAAAIDAGIINGMTDTTIGSNLTATRAQSATMLKRFLSNASFIN